MSCGARRYRVKHDMRCGLHGDACRLLRVRPGWADLTLKVKDVELDAFPLLHDKLHFPSNTSR